MKGILLTGWMIAAGLFSASGAERDVADLFDAVAKRDVQQVRSLLEGGVSVGVRNEVGHTPLIVAARQGDLPMAELLIAKGADANDLSTKGSLVLGFATDGGNVKLMELLWRHGARIDDRARDGVTALEYAAGHGKLAPARFLLEKGANPNRYASRNEVSFVWLPLHAAVLNDDLPMAELLLRHGARLEQRNNRGSTVLMEAAKQQNSATVQWLIKKGANVNATGPQGHTALIYAAYNGRIESVKMLLAAGANPNAQATDSVYPDYGGTYNAERVAQEQGFPEAVALVAEARKRATK